jgi:hypothetical protein
MTESFERHWDSSATTLALPCPMPRKARLPENLLRGSVSDAAHGIQRQRPRGLRAPGIGPPAEGAEASRS